MERVRRQEKFSDYPGSLTVHMQPQERPSKAACTQPCSALTHMYLCRLLSRSPPLSPSPSLSFSGCGLGDNVAQRREQPPIDVDAMHVPTLTTELAMDDDDLWAAGPAPPSARGRTAVAATATLRDAAPDRQVLIWIVRQRRKGSSEYTDFDKDPLPVSQYGQFYAGDRCVRLCVSVCLSVCRLCFSLSLCMCRQGHLLSRYLCV
jgi:hypothetical protein